MDSPGLLSRMAGDFRGRHGGRMSKPRKRPGLFQRGAIWHVAIYHGGQAIRRSLETDDREAAEEAYDKIRAEIWNEKHLGKKPEATWDDAALAYLRRYKARVEAGERREVSLRHDASRLAMLTERLKGTPLSAITRKFVERMTDGQPAQLHNSSLISAVLGCAVDEELIPSRPNVTVGKTKRRTRYLDQNEARQLLSQSGYLADAVLFSLATGLRQTNALRLRWDWIKDRTVIIPAERFKQDRDHVQPLNRTAMAVLQRQIGRHSEFVFSYKGRPYRTETEPEGHQWGYHWTLARKGLQNLRWHDLRHTWASWSLQAGVPEPIVETLGGWSSGKMVRRYAHASAEFLRSYAEAIDPVLASIQHASNTGSPGLVSVK